MTEEKNALMPQQLILEDRHLLRVSGVKAVDRFDDKTVVASTVQGKLHIQGETLRVTKLALEQGDLSVEGKIDGLLYTGDGKSSRLSALFK